MKIRSKLFVLLVSLILTSLLAASFVSINVLSTAMIRDVKANLEEDSSNLMNGISMNTSNSISDIRFLGHSLNIFPNHSGTDLVKLEVLKKFIGTRNDYSFYSVYNKTGIKIADSRGIGIGQNVANESFFKKAIQGDIYRGISSSNNLKPSKEKEILFSGPLYNNSNEINGILLLSYPLNIKLTEQVSTGSQSNVRINLLSDDGKVIYSSYGNILTFQYYESYFVTSRYQKVQRDSWNKIEILLQIAEYNVEEIESDLLCRSESMALI